MDIIFTDEDLLTDNEDILIHMFFNLLNYDYREGIFSNESSIYDMEGCNFTNEDYIFLFNQYQENKCENASYKEGCLIYQKMVNTYFDNMLISNFKKAYDLDFNKKKHLLIDLVSILKENFQNKDWKKDNLFILKTLDNRAEKKDFKSNKNNSLNENEEKIIKFPIKKKLSKDEIKNSCNQILIMSELNMTWEEAYALVEINYDKKMKNKIFEPYYPED